MDIRTVDLNLLVVFGVMGGLFLVLVQFMQAVVGYSAIKSALSLLPMAMIMMPLWVASRSERLPNQWGAYESWDMLARMRGPSMKPA